MKILQTVGLATVAGAMLLGGCSDDLLRGPNDGPERLPDEVTNVDGSESPLTVRTRFIVDGLDDIADGVHIDSLSMNVGAIFLDPLTDQDTGFSFANRHPFNLDFALSDGFLEEAGPEMHLPFGGDFVVSVQLEPDDEQEVTVEIAGAYVETVEVEDGMDRTEPMPLPWRNRARTPSDRRLQQVVPFTYRSNRVARLQVADISLDQYGDYELVITLEIDNWVEETVLPAVQSRQARSFEAHFNDRLNVENVTVEEGVGIEGLIGDMGVEAQRDNASEE